MTADGVEIIEEIARNRDEGRGLFVRKNESAMHVGRRTAVKMNVAQGKDSFWFLLWLEKAIGAAVERLHYLIIYGLV